VVAGGVLSQVGDIHQIMRVTDLPETDRPRERLFSSGTEALADRELLALLIGSGTAGTDAIDLAAQLIERCGGLARLARADPHALLSLPGMGPAKAARVAAAFQLARRAENGSTPRRIGCSADLAEAASPLLRGLRVERVVVVACNQAGNILRTVRITDGCSDQSPVPIRDVLTAVLTAGGTAFGIAHNHPSGGLAPSDADRQSTAHLRQAAETVGLRFLDHIIVTDKEWSRIQG
jgi:DNA repair protein RadC